jgi:DNA-binding LacI/PurR family transcriptional regulator
VRPLSAVDPVGEFYLRERLAGFREAITAAGLDTSQVNLVEATNIDMDSGMAAAAQLIAAAEPTAIVATSDVHAVALKVRKAEHISVPDQVSVIGFDDAPIAHLMDLTTLRQPLADKGREAATILLELIAGRTRRRSVKPTQLIVRATVGPVPHC